MKDNNSVWIYWWWLKWKVYVYLQVSRSLGNGLTALETWHARHYHYQDYLFALFLVSLGHSPWSCRKGRDNKSVISPNETVGQLSWIEELFCQVIETGSYTGFLSRELKLWKLECFVTLNSCWSSRLKLKAKMTWCWRNLVYYFSTMWCANQYILKPW